MLDTLKIEDIQNEEQKYIAELIGIASYVKLVKEFGGTSIYILKEDSLIKELRDKKIREEFKGGNYSALAKKYNLTEMTIRNIINDNCKLNGQISFSGFFDTLK